MIELPRFSRALVLVVLTAACGGQPDRAEPPGGYTDCAYDAVTGQGDPGNDPSCESAVPGDPSAAVVEPSPGG